MAKKKAKKKSKDKAKKEQHPLSLVLQRDDGKVYRIPMSDLKEYEISAKEKLAIDKRLGRTVSLSCSVACPISCCSDW